MADTPEGGTPTAQDDVLGEATRATAPLDGADAEVGTDGALRERGPAGQEDGEARPGATRTRWAS